MRDEPIVRPAGEAELDQANPDNFLQQWFWGRHKAEFGWRPHSLALQWQGGSCVVLALERSLGAGFSFLYVPHGPGPRMDGALLAQLAKRMAAAVGKRCLFVRFDLPWALGERSCRGEGADEAAFAGGELRGAFALKPLARAAADIQPPDTVLLDLTIGREALLAQMRPKTRYNIRLAEKKGVRVETADPSRLDDWYELYRLTAERDRIAIHSRDYYRRLFEGNPDKMSLLLAWHENDLLAGTIMMRAGARATYLYGASSNVKRNLMPAYALQWAGIGAAIDQGCAEYDFGGVPPSNDPGHPMHGLFQFKTGFGGSLVSYPGCFDASGHPLLYRLFGAAEALRGFYFKTLKKR